MEIVTRTEWNARPARSTSSVTWGQVTGVTVHHSATPVTATIRSIQDYHMDHNRWADIGYNHLVKGGKIYEGRGWLVKGVHDKVNTNLGVCIVGTFTDSRPADADLAALDWYVAEARRRAGRHLDVVGHRDVPGNSTACPGDRLWTLIHDGRFKEDSMPTAKEIADELATHPRFLAAVGKAVWTRVNPTKDEMYGTLLRRMVDATARLATLVDELRTGTGPKT